MPDPRPDPLSERLVEAGDLDGLLRRIDDLCAAGAICADTETCQNGDCYERCVIPTPIGALGDRRSPPLTCPESPTCVDGEPATCVPHGAGFGVHTCEQTVPGEPLVHVIRHCDGACADGECL